MKTLSIKSSQNFELYKSHLSKSTPDVIICTGPAGSGKTMHACQFGIQHLKSNSFKKMIITRPSVSIDEDLGYLPGDIDKKMYPMLIPIYDQLETASSRNFIHKLLYNETIEIVPLGFLRGRTFDNTIIIADEMQNSTISQMLTLLTRLGKNSKLIITGDLDQCDLSILNGLEDFIIKLTSYDEENISSIHHVSLDESDIMRSDIVKDVLKIYDSYDK
jgi:phosphate starvation-inducible PhoH-like protein